MTREEAIEIFLNRGWITLEGGTYFDGDKWREAIMVISDYFQNEYKALEQEPCEDCISREDAKEKLKAHREFFLNSYGGFSQMTKEEKARVDEIDNCVAEIMNLPSVTPEPRTLSCSEKPNKWMSEARRWKRRYLDLKHRYLVLEQQTRWIPVSERLPEIGIDVLICDMEGTIYLSRKSSFGSFFDEWGNKIKDIRAWMPLPEPYKEVQE